MCILTLKKHVQTVQKQRQYRKITRKFIQPNPQNEVPLWRISGNERQRKLLSNQTQFHEQNGPNQLKHSQRSILHCNIQIVENTESQSLHCHSQLQINIVNIRIKRLPPETIHWIWLFKPRQYQPNITKHNPFTIRRHSSVPEPKKPSHPHQPRHHRILSRSTHQNPMGKRPHAHWIGPCNILPNDPKRHVHCRWRWHLQALVHEEEWKIHLVRVKINRSETPWCNYASYRYLGLCQFLKLNQAVFYLAALILRNH